MKTKVTYFSKARGKYMLAKSPQKLCGCQGHRLGFAPVGIRFVGKFHPVLIYFKYAVVGDGYFVAIPPYVLYHLLSTTEGLFGIDNPFFIEYIIELIAALGYYEALFYELTQPRHKLRLVGIFEVIHRKQEVFAIFLIIIHIITFEVFPLAIWPYATRWHYAMNPSANAQG